MNVDASCTHVSTPTEDTWKSARIWGYNQKGLEKGINNAKDTHYMARRRINWHHKGLATMICKKFDIKKKYLNDSYFLWNLVWFIH